MTMSRNWYGAWFINELIRLNGDEVENVYVPILLGFH